MKIQIEKNNMPILILLYTIKSFKKVYTCCSLLCSLYVLFLKYKHIFLFFGLFQKTHVSFFVTLHKLLIRFFLGDSFKGGVPKLL